MLPDVWLLVYAAGYSDPDNNGDDDNDDEDATMTMLHTDVM